MYYSFMNVSYVNKSAKRAFFNFEPNDMSAILEVLEGHIKYVDTTGRGRVRIYLGD